MIQVKQKLVFPLKKKKKKKKGAKQNQKPI